MRARNLALATGGAALIAAGTAAVATTQADGAAAKPKLPVSAIERIIGADGHVSQHVLAIDVSRDDLHAKGPDGTPFKPGFQLQHELAFQAIGHGKAIVNGDLALSPRETQKVISGLLAHHLRFQAFHQHLYDMSPTIWYIHFRGVAGPRTLAHEVRAVINETGAKLPQKSPAHPTSPLPSKQLAKILGGDATIGENGIVTVDVPRRNSVRLSGVRVSPDLNVANNVQFQPLGAGRAAVVPDFSMTAREIDRVVHRMRAYGWDVGCLYNQEVAESPQLYFAHMYKTGNAVTLARQIRRALNLTAATH